MNLGPVFIFLNPEAPISSRYDRIRIRAHIDFYPLPPDAQPARGSRPQHPTDQAVPPRPHARLRRNPGRPAAPVAALPL